MAEYRVSAASGTSDDWARSPLILGIGQLAWETDTRVLRVGDGINLEQDLPIAAQEKTDSPFVIDDSKVSGSSAWSSLKSQSADSATLIAAKQYTDQAVQQSPAAGSAVYAIVQNANGTYPARPSVGGTQVVFWFQIVANTPPPAGVMQTNDQLIVRS